jgi:NAD(P) transhydrogenase subunit beta
MLFGMLGAKHAPFIEASTTGLIACAVLLLALEANEKMKNVDVIIVVGANDVVNPSAYDDPGSPIYGMPVINVDSARTVFVLKRSMASGFAGIENPLFYKENTRMLFGDAKESIGGLIREFS